MHHARRVAAVVAVGGWLWLAALATAGLSGYPASRPAFEAAGLTFGAGLFAVAALAQRPRLAVSAWLVPGWVVLPPVILAVAAYAWTLLLGPLSDDYVLRAWADAGQWVPTEWPYWRPLPLLIWHGLGVVGEWTPHHVFNVALHAVNSSLVASLAVGWLGPVAGLTAGCVFALFGGSMEAVGWAAGVFDLTCTCMILTTLFVWQRVQHPVVAIAGVALAAGAALASKETAIVLPTLLLTVGGAVGFTAVQRRGLLVVAAAAAVYGLGRLVSSPTVGQHARSLPWGRRAWKDLFVRPYSAAAVPLRTEDGFGVDAYTLGLCVLCLCGIPLARWLWRPESAQAGRAFALSVVGLAWVLLSALPLLETFDVTPALEGSRYLYLPSAGLALALSAAMPPSPGRGALFSSLPVLLLLAVYSRGLATERAAWLAAASTRDALLAEVGRETRSHGCSTIAVEDLPDSLSGVYVFRNGIHLAVSQFTVAPPGRDCVLRWSAFRRRAVLVSMTP